MKKIAFLLSAVAVLLPACKKSPSAWTDRDVPGKPLETWSFSLDGRQWEKVSVPHSYNAIDGRSPSYYRGTAYYKTTLPRYAADAPRYLLFEGVGQAAVVLVDGDTLKTHSGAYTPFWVNVSGRGGSEVTVICDNREDWARIPLTSDFNKNGGIHYPVWLLECPPVHFGVESFGLYRLHVATPSVSKAAAKGRATTLLRNASGQARHVDVEWKLEDAEGKEVLSCQVPVDLAAGEAQELEWNFLLQKPHLWDGMADPYLYQVSVRAGEDVARTQIGFRWYSLDRDKGFFLNGKPYPLRGVALHQDKEGIASAFRKADIDADYELVRELGCNFLRLAHYPHNDYAFRLCDRMGIVVQTEIPWVNNCGTEAPDAYFTDIFNQMREMVTSLYNHPSICFWGMWNELDTWSHEPYKVHGKLDSWRVVRETEKLYRYTKKLDPWRSVGLTDDSVFQREGYTQLKADYYSENRYHGWYYDYDHFEGLTGRMEWIRDRMGVTNISEYGVGVNPFCHTWNPELIRRDRSDSLHVEEFGNLFHESYAAQIARMPFLNFTSIWILSDFAVARRQEGFMDSEDGVNFTVNEARKYTNDKGLVTRDKKLRKDAFYLYKSWWNKAVETVHITSKRLKYRPAGEPFTLTVYSNAPSLELFCNGEKAGSLAESGEPTGVVWKFDTRMGDGPTTFRVQAPDGTFDEVTFDALRFD